MRFYRLLAVALAAAIMFTGRPIAGRSEQTAATPSGASAFDALHFRQIGPASMSGRIADLAVYEANPSLYYVGTAHGGVWKTTNNGTTFEAQFQDQGLMSIGDVTISQSNPDLVWVGTGESNNRQSTSWGDGVYKSTDGGKTYVNMGLRASRHINRIVIDPRDNDVVLVAATGSLWGAGGDRGVYKTSDGGRTWKQVLTVDDDTGANDLVMDPSNNQVLWASMYQRRRSPCCMNGGGPGSGIWKSIDGGETWTRLKGGVLDGPLGRIAIDVYRKRPNILYALIEGPVAAGRGGRGAGGGEEGPGTAPAAQEGAGGGRGAGSGPPNAAPTGMYRSDDAGATWRKVSNANPFQRGVSVFPSIEAPVFLASPEDLAQVYAPRGTASVPVGTVYQASSVPAYLRIDDLMGKHFSIVGTTGSGKSCAVATILRAVIDHNPNAHVMLLDPHNEYARAFPDRAVVLSPDDGLRLPYWLFNFEELAEIVLGNERSDMEQRKILGEIVLAAKQTQFLEDRTRQGRQRATRRFPIACRMC